MRIFANIMLENETTELIAKRLEILLNTEIAIKK